MKKAYGDISDMEDLSFAVINLISIEEHLAFTLMKTGKGEYLHVLNAVRKLRIASMKRLVKNTEGELWCISKHLLSATMRMMETANKFTEKEPEQAEKFMRQAFDLYGLFWLLQTGEIEKEGNNAAGRAEAQNKKLEK